jgi:uncharacterized protein YbaP (TraB family)
LGYVAIKAVALPCCHIIEIESVLISLAKTPGKVLTQLETVAIQRAALMGGSPAEQTVAIEHHVSALESGKTREEIRGIAEAWAQGNPDWLEEHSKDKPEMFPLAWNRNPGIVAGIAELHERSRRVFAAVGILHMISDQALPKLLAERGFTVERVVLNAH